LVPLLFFPTNKQPPAIKKSNKLLCEQPSEPLQPPISPSHSVLLSKNPQVQNLKETRLEGSQGMTMALLSSLSVDMAITFVLFSFANTTTTPPHENQKQAIVSNSLLHYCE
jgi:hypothetical protein